MINAAERLRTDAERIALLTAQRDGLYERMQWIRNWIKSRCIPESDGAIALVESAISHVDQSCIPPTKEQG